MFKLRYDELAYMPEYTRELTGKGLAAMRKEYSRMRDTAQKRIQRLGESKYNTSQAYLANKMGFEKLADISEADLPYKIFNLYKFVTAKSSTVSGQRAIERKRAESFKASPTFGKLFAGMSVDEINDFAEYLGILIDESKDYKYKIRKELANFRADQADVEAQDPKGIMSKKERMALLKEKMHERKTKAAAELLKAVQNKKAGNTNAITSTGRPSKTRK